MSHHFSHSILGGSPAISENADSLAKSHGMLEVDPPLVSNVFSAPW